MEGKTLFGRGGLAERLIEEGSDACSTLELMSLVLGTKRAAEQAAKVAEVFGRNLLSAFPEELMRCGLTRRDATRLKAAVTLGRRLCSEPPVDRPTIYAPEDVVRLVGPEMSELEQEEMWVLLVDVRHRVRMIERLYRGSASNVMVRVAEVFRTAVRIGAAALIVVHNHPSGDPSPSREDMAITKAFAEAGKLLDIEVLDHIVIGHGSFMSLKSKWESW